MGTQQIVILAAGIVLLLVLTALPQWRARKQRERQTRDLRVGDEVMTVGGIVGTIRFLDKEQNRVRLEVAPGVEMTFALAAIGRTLVPDEGQR